MTGARFDPYRPRLHLTAEQGWINDPLGLTFHDGRYHVFFQYVPGGTTWDLGCHWGHATSDDLLRWTHRPVALAPGDGDDGCWSGSVVTSAGQQATMFYTSVTGPDPGVGRVRVAHAADPAWDRWDKGPVVAALPDGVAAVAYRDPFVFRDGDTWRMLVGAGLPDGTATALAYSSPDLGDWRYDGLLAQRSTHDTEPVWTGSLWECPQLFPLGDRHVLVVSVWDDNRLNHVAYATGDYADGRFEAFRWHRLTYGPCHYAASAFTDHQGRRGLVHWLRGVTDPGGAWAGALSVPHLLALRGDRVHASPHPALAAWRRDPPGASGDSGRRASGVTCADVEWSAPPAGQAELQLVGDDGTAVARLRLVGGELALTVSGQEALSASLPEADRGEPVRVLFDGPVLEVFAGGAVLGMPLPGDGRLRPELAPDAGSLRWWELSPPG